MLFIGLRILPVHYLGKFVNSLLFEHDLRIELLVETIDILLQTLKRGHALGQSGATTAELVNLLCLFTQHIYRIKKQN